MRKSERKLFRYQGQWRGKRWSRHRSTSFVASGEKHGERGCPSAAHGSHGRAHINTAPCWNCPRGTLPMVEQVDAASRKLQPMESLHSRLQVGPAAYGEEPIVELYKSYIQFLSTLKIIQRILAEEKWKCKKGTNLIRHSSQVLHRTT